MPSPVHDDSSGRDRLPDYWDGEPEARST
jgi:hypothetical protein